MCAITGIANHHRPAAAEGLIRDMASAMQHRGPDDSGFFVDRDIALGHRRLIVIDPATGNQPVFNEDKSVVAVFNGEIYNFRELRSELVKLGHTFRSASDTEVLVHLYEEMDRECVTLLDGMFAFALYDFKNKRLLLARDRLGQKPLFYFQHRDQLVFASELGGLKRHPAMNRELNAEAVSDFLSLQYIPGSSTVYRYVKRLAPGHLAEFNLSENHLAVYPYWHSSFAFKCSELSFEDAADQLQKRVEKAVEKRLVSDVPLGVFLSGGMDSAVISSIAAEKLAPGRCQAFSIGFTSEKYDERQQAQLTANWIDRKYHNLDHHIRTVNAADFSLLRMLARHYGEPFADASMMPTAMLCQFAREQLTVALSGDGADELFGGYERYLAMRLFDRVSSTLPGKCKYLFGALAALLPDSGERTGKGRMRRFLRLLSSPESEAYFNLLNRCSQTRKKRLFQNYWNEISERDTADFFRILRRQLSGKDPRELYSELDLNSYLPGDILVKVDIASMSCGLEVRSPFLDRDVVDFASRLPWEYKQHKNERKSILRQAFSSRLPAELFTRPKKGFGLPVAEYLRGAWKYEAAAMLLEGRISRTLVNRSELLQIWRQHLSGQRDWSYLLFNLLILEIFISNEAES